MLAIMKKCGYTFSEAIEGRKAILVVGQDGFVTIRGSEVMRLGGSGVYPNSMYILNAHEYTPVQPKLQNCSNSNVGKGWEGYYDQKPIRKSKFRNH